jgi:hypothetical protein
MSEGFSEGNRVIVSQDFFWAKGATGTVGRPPAEIVALSGPWENDGLTQQERSALGVNTVYFVYFDDPQFDADGDGPYRGGQIWATALNRLSQISN